MAKLTKHKIRSLFSQEGFQLVGFLNKGDCNLGNWIQPWLDRRFHADMQWMEHYLDIRSNPSVIEDYANTIISAAISYKTNPPEKWSDNNPISNYAWGEDYHLVVRKKLKKIIELLQKHDPEFKGRACVDTAPLPEKIIALKSGLGWIGRNSMLLNRKLGSYLFLGEIVTNLDLPSDVPAKDYCGKCRKCIDACPTQAIHQEYLIDSNRCISYLTIEKRGEFTALEKSLLKYQIFGCDVCQQVCPWNKKAPVTDFKPFGCDNKWINLDLKKPENLTIERFNQLKIKSPIKRTKYDGFIRNIRTVAKKNQS